MTIKAMKQALEFIDSVKVHPTQIASRDALHDTLSTAIEAAKKQEPVAWANINKHGDVTHTNNKRMPWSKTPLYTTPPAAQRQPLTDDRIGQIIEQCKITLVNYCSGEKQTEFARAIEAAHGITGEKPDAA
jgi:hypothetical protein